MGTLPEDYNLHQCFFGEHLLGLHPEATVCKVENEKSALISAAIFPDEIWLAAGGINGLQEEKCKVLENRTVILYPDLNAFEKWSEKAFQIEKHFNCKISVSTLLEDTATLEAKAKGLDIVDCMIFQLKSKELVSNIQTPPNQSRFTPKLQQMINQNKSLLLLIDKLELIEL